MYGSVERFFGILIEHYAGAFPLWLAPVQVAVLPITDRHADYARSVHAKLEARGLRSHLDDRKEKVNLKIREAQIQKVPYMLVVGDREAESGTVCAPSQARRPRRKTRGSIYRGSVPTRGVEIRDGITARTILSSTSGDIAEAGFTHSLTPARNCTFGCTYCYVPTLGIYGGLKPEDWKRWVNSPPLNRMLLNCCTAN